MGAAGVVAVLGLGEAGSLLAADLVAAGAAVRTYDPAVRDPVSGAAVCRDEADAARGADLVLSVNSAADAIALCGPGCRGSAAVRCGPTSTRRRRRSRAGSPTWPPPRASPSPTWR